MKESWLTANERRPFAIGGTYFEVLSCSANVGVNVQFFRDGQEITSAEMADVLPGTYALPAGGFSAFVITSPAVQVVKWAVASGEGGSRRIAGEVSVVDGSGVRSSIGAAFVGRMAVGALAANYSHVQLWNPAGSGVRAIVNQWTAWSAIIGQLQLRRFNTALSTLFAAQFAESKLLGGAVSKCEQRTQQAGSLLGVHLTSVSAQPNVSFQERVTEPIVIMPGQGIVWAHPTVNSDIAAYPHFFEEAI